jgi:hypothetical protein
VKRREFITLLGGAAASWPLAALAQQPERMRRIGVLSGGAVADDPDAEGLLAAFLQGLQQLGWTDGRSIRLFGGTHRKRPRGPPRGRRSLIAHRGGSFPHARP